MVAENGCDLDKALTEAKFLSFLQARIDEGFEAYSLTPVRIGRHRVKVGIDPVGNINLSNLQSAQDTHLLLSDGNSHYLVNTYTLNAADQPRMGTIERIEGNLQPGSYAIFHLDDRTAGAYHPKNALSTMSIKFKPTSLLATVDLAKDIEMWTSHSDPHDPLYKSFAAQTERGGLTERVLYGTTRALSMPAIDGPVTAALQAVRERVSGSYARAKGRGQFAPSYQ